MSLQKKLEASATLDAELFAARHKLDALLKKGGAAQLAREGAAAAVDGAVQRDQLLKRCETTESRASQVAALNTRLIIAINHLRGEMLPTRRALKHCAARVEQLDAAISDYKQGVHLTLGARSRLLKLDKRRRLEEGQAKTAHVDALNGLQHESRRLDAANEAAQVAHEENEKAAQEQAEAAALAEQARLLEASARLDELRWRREGLEVTASELQLMVGGLSMPGRAGEPSDGTSDALVAFRDREESIESLRSFLAVQEDDVARIEGELAELAEAEEHEVATLQRRRAQEDESMGEQVQQAAVETEMRRRNSEIEVGLDDVFAAFTSLARLVKCRLPSQFEGQPCTLHTVDAYLTQLDERTTELLLRSARDRPVLTTRIRLRPQSPETTDFRPTHLPSMDDELEPLRGASFLTANDSYFGA